MIYRKINRAGFELIKRSEGLRLDAYLCPAGVPTIGYGHTGPDVRLGDHVSEEEAEALLRDDLVAFSDGVDDLLTVDVEGNPFSALVCFAYNVGLEALRKSTLLRLANAGDVAAAADQFLRWNKAAGKVLPGLTQRRAAERLLFLTPGDGDEVA